MIVILENKKLPLLRFKNFSLFNILRLPIISSALVVSPINKETMMEINKNNLTLEKFNDEAYVEIKEYFSVLKERYKLIYKTFEKKKDSVQQIFIKPTAEYINFLDKTKGEKHITKAEHKKLRRFLSKLKDKSFQNFKNKYKNKALQDFVTNINADITGVTDEDNDNVIQKSNPIYLDPYDFDYLQAHFYAPKKKLFGVYFDTFTANVLVIWSMTVFLIFTLYVDAFKKTLDLFGRLGSIIPSFKKKK